MIRTWTIVRAAPAFWLSIPICLLAGYYVTLLRPSDGYGLDATAKASAVLPLVGAFCSACAAWEGNRLRRAHVWKAPFIRSRLEVVIWCITPAVIVSVAALGVAVGSQLLRSSAGAPDIRIIGVAALDLLAYSVAGFALGVLLPFAVAGPVAIVGTVVWLAFVPAMDPPWLRHLTGMFRDCCGLSEDLSLRAVAASISVDLGIVAAAAVVIATAPLPARRVATALGTLGVALVGGVVAVNGMTYAPTAPRDTTALSCLHARTVEVCTWPEHRQRAQELTSVVATVYSRWLAAGIQAPSHFTEAAPTQAAGDAVSFYINASTYSRDEIVGALAAALLPPPPGCYGGGTGSPAYIYLEGWYVHTAGISEEAWLEHYEADMDPLPTVTSVVEALTAASAEARRDWIARAEAISQACEEWDPRSLAVNP